MAKRHVLDTTIQKLGHFVNINKENIEAQVYLEVMTELLPFFVVLFAGLFFSELFNRLHLPWVVALILGGIIIGPSALGIFEPSQTVTFLGEIGLVFLMFIAGLEVQIPSKTQAKKIGILSLLNGLIPFAAGYGIAIFFGYQPMTALLLGTIFISSSIAVVIPSLEATNLISRSIGRSIISATIFQDMASLLILSFILQKIHPTAEIPLFALYSLLILFVVALRVVIPRIEQYFEKNANKGDDPFQQELRAIFTILIGTTIIFELLGIHAIIAGFFAGAIVARSIKSKIIKDRLRTISYGLFIPIFFVVIGAKTDISVFASAQEAIILTLVIILGSSIAKFVSGWFGGLVSGFTKQESALIGISTLPQLSTTLAVAFTAQEENLIAPEITIALVALTIVSTLISPLLIKKVSGKVEKLEPKGS